MSSEPRRSAAPPGTPLVGTADALGRFFGVPGDQVATAIAEMDLPPWGADGLGRQVWRLRDVDAALGRPDTQPGPGWGGSILGTRGAARGRQQAQETRRAPGTNSKKTPKTLLGPLEARERAGG